MKDTIVGDEWRWAIVVLGFAASFVMAWLLRLTVRRAKARKALDRPLTAVEQTEAMRDRGEVPALIGGSAVCLFIGTGTLGVILDLDSIFRLPFMATALAYTVVGRGLQLLHRRKDH
jgi:hypothetical protein